MLNLKDFYQAHNTELTADACTRLPTACITPVTVDFHRLPGDAAFRDKCFGDIFNPDFTAKIEALSPLSAQVLGALCDAGHDPLALKYSLRFDDHRVVATPCYEWHSDAAIYLRSFRTDLQSGARIIKTVLSDICPTATLPQGVFANMPSGTDQSLYFLCLLKGITGYEINMAWKNAFDQFGQRKPHADSVKSFTERMHQFGKAAREQALIPAAGHAVHFNHIMPHAWTCVIDHNNSPHQQMRRRVMLDVVLG